MIDLVCIFTTGGIILFQQIYSQSCKLEVIQNLIQNNIAKEKDEESILVNSYRVQYIKSQENNIIFAVAFQDFLKIQKIDVLLEMIKSTFLEKIFDNVVIEKNLIKSIPPFKEEFEQLVNKWNLKNQKDQKKQKMAKSFYETKKGQELLKTTQQGKSNYKAQADIQQQKKNEKKGQVNSQHQFNHSNSGSDQDSGNDETEGMTEEELVEYNRQKLLNKRMGGSGQRSPKQSQISQQDDNEYKIKKNKREGEKVTKKSMQQLDYSKINDGDELQNMKETYLGGEDEKLENFDDESSSDEEEAEQIIKKKGFFGKLANKIKVVTGNKVIDEQDLEPVLTQFKEHLAGKNIAEEMAQKICESIKINLLKTKSIAFTSLHKVVKESLASTLSKVLTPKQNIDPIAEALRAKERGKPYVMVFIGVNGVGKSTNLAKVAYLFKSQGFKVMLAACDNFRAGAVEQIKTHGRCLDVPVFDRGYGKDAADIAFEAIREATIKKYEVVLIDTAGRMQNNEPLMRQLSKLVIMNNPDLITFIGEALVGNDGLDQLNKFNQSLIDLSPNDKVRQIDGIILSKFDTVDDKVGAAITMTYQSGKPILFVGVGQKYTHLRKLNVRTVVNSLLA
ncbi:Signal recognition particle, SRP54 subunit, helical bundle [Pseudocohnilembus persalinus]|uniref:Signal recognition particle, SRP54 subunit, helical bundle n=1 Tax=Pseudocohnilembus persalinus TaxID=266149 RepID=A0A0V0R5T1_PSEPJ|nr:Signal recognition particle, SRP54 subunit, helical bundle [Pseudocohnilembus persalinus]|eukprot:KRX09862.1 Signal recognition particle, SRP54 subunit, helical bundle [Pseudocohnilembus persalinus]